MPTLVVIGYRDDLDRALLRRGLDPFYLVQAPAGPPEGRRFARVADMENAQEILRAVLSARPGDVAGVLSVHEMGVFGAACLRRQLGLPGNTDSRTALYFRDKYLQKSALPPGIERARCRYVPQGTSFADLAGELGAPFVVKPANGAGSLRTAVVDSPDAYARALEPFPDRSDVEIVAESLVDAPEVYLDGIWVNGALRWSSMSRYHVSPLSAVQGGVLAAHIVDAARSPELYRRAGELAGQVLGHLGAPDCVFHMEAFETGPGLTFGECAIRLPGALSPRINHLTFGVDLFDAEISLALGEEVTQGPGAAPDRFHGYMLLRRPEHGTLTQGDFERAFTFDEISYDSSPDAPVGPYGRVGTAIVSDEDELKLRRTIEEIARFNLAGGSHDPRVASGSPLYSHRIEDHAMSIHESLAVLRRAAETGTVIVTASEPASAEAVRDRETGLEPHFGTVEWMAPPSYRAFLAEHNTFACKRWDSATDGYKEFVVVGDDAIAELNSDLVHLPEHVDRGDGRWLSTNHLVGFALADANSEGVWCFDVTQPGENGEYPVYYHHYDDQDGHARYVEGGDWEDGADSVPDFPSFAAWLDAMANAFTATEPPGWFGELGAPYFNPNRRR